MDHKHEPDNSVMFEFESDETNEQLDAFEQRLKATRPQPPQLNAAALMREADEQIVQRRGSMVQRSLWLVGSWTFGAAIGASVMFVLMSSSSQETESLQRTATVVEPALPSILPNAPTIAKHELSETGNSHAMLTLDLLDDGPAGYLASGRTLQVGMHLRRNNRIADQPLQVARYAREPDPHQSELESTKTFTPPKPTTREELMRELLEETFGAVL
jgi:hypothetical protein